MGSRKDIIRELREEVERYGYSNLARDSGFNRSNIYRMVNDDSNITLMNFFTLVNTLGLKVKLEKK